MTDLPATLALTAFRKESTVMRRISYATGSLASALLRLSGRLPQFQDPFTSDLSPIMVMISWIYHLPIAHRKAMLDATRIQAPVWINTALTNSFTNLTPVTIYSDLPDHPPIVLYASDLARYFDRIYPFPLLCSLLSYFVRAESTIHIQEFLEQKTVSLDKELSAALFYEDHGSILDYTGLYGQSGSHLHPQLPGRMNPRLFHIWESGIRHIAQLFSSVGTPPLLPSYNSRKNVSYSTCRWYYETIGDSDVEYAKDVTTLDLLKLYYSTGCEARGSIEMRQAWFFNELKPRTYYCLGGTDFFHGMHIQEIANLFVNILPSTNPFTRFTVERLGSLEYDDLLITYDYSSFTTSLPELKFFLFWLAENVPDVVVPILDVFRGVRDLSLKRILHDYNNSVNLHQVFSIERFQEAEELVTLRQGRSGSLGVKGNIVFSTTLHGLALADITGMPDRDCCVGDDALAITRAYFIAIFISCVNNLGSINPDKFTTLSRLSDPEATIFEQQYKFLKRPLNINPQTNVPILGKLDFFPSVADVLFPNGDGVHTVTPGYSGYNSARTFAMQVGRYYRIHLTSEDPTILSPDGDLELILLFLRAGYVAHGLPFEGGIPGDFLVKWGEDNVREGDFFCPPMDTLDVFTTPWMELLLNRFYGRETTIPMTLGGTVAPPLELCMGLRFHATSDVKVLQLGVDLGFLEKRVELIRCVFDSSICDAAWEKMIGGGKNVEPLYAEYIVVSPSPSWWYDMVIHYHPMLLPEDPLDVAERLTSVLGSID